MNYWQRRQQELAAQMGKDEERLKKRLSSYYDSEYRKLERQIAEYYQQYGEDNVIQYRRLMESLPEADRRLLIEQMDKFAEKYPQYADLMPVRESIYRLNRLEGLQYSVRMQQLEIGAVNNEQMGEHLKKQAARNANAAAETMGYGKNFYSENSSLVQKIMGSKWCNGKDFSERIWENANKLAEYLITDISQGFVRGDSYARLTRQLKQRFGKVSRNDAYRLIYTEGTYVMNESRAAAFEQDTDEYIFRVQYDRIRSKGWRDICDDLDGKTFLWSERTAGVNFPPMHPWCHCTATPYISDREKWLEDYENRHGNGQAEKASENLGIMPLQVPEDVTKIKGLTIQDKKEIESAILKLQKEYNIHLDSIEMAAMGKKTIFGAAPYPDNDGKLRFSLVLNQDIDYNNVKQKISKRYKAGLFSGNSIEDYIAHEMAHIMTYQDCKTQKEYETKKKIIQKAFVEGVSGYADREKNGEESLAEAFVKYRNGEALPIRAKLLVMSYIERWKK